VLTLTHNTDVGFILAVIAVVIGVVVLVQSRLTSLLAWAVVLGFLGVAAVWWAI
jgi:hypothetical protein